MKKDNFILKRLLNTISSSKLALYLVIALIILSFIAVVVPQESEFTSTEIETWSSRNQVITSIIDPLGFFSVFRSIPFLVIIILFAINILTCTFLNLSLDGGILSLKSWTGIKKTGFLILHLALIGILAGGFITTGVGMDGTIILTEGQTFTEREDNYIKLTKGTFRRSDHKNFFVRLNKVKIKYEDDVIPVKVVTTLDFRSSDKKKTGVDIEINYPFKFKGIDFTQDEIGFSPRIIIKDPVKREVLLNSFVALKTFRHGNKWEYKDFLPLPFLKNRVILTLLPDHKGTGENISKTGELAGNPVILFKTEDESGELITRGNIPFKGSAKIGELIFEFADLRYWASFRVVDDPGYIVFGFSIWLALFSLVLRYSEELVNIFSKNRRSVSISPAKE